MEQQSNFHHNADRAGQKPPETLTTQEAEALLNMLVHGMNLELTRAKELRNYTIALLMLDAGLRVGEVVKLEIRDLVFNGEPVKSVTIRQEISKTKAERTIPLSDRLQTALAVMISRLPNAGVIQGTRTFFYRGISTLAATKEYIDNYPPLTTRQVQNIIADASFAAFGRKIHPHVLRHTFGTRIERIAGARAAQILLGHKSLMSTQIYTHKNQDELTAAIQAASKNSSGQAP